MPPMHIHQLSASYEAIQDRIVLRINTHEGQHMALWFTRRFLRQLFPTLLRYEAEAALHSAAAHSPSKTQAHSPEAQQMLAELKREEVLGGSDFATPYLAPAPQTSQDFAPMLVTQVRFSQGEAAGQIGMHFEEDLPPAAARGLHLSFSSSVLMGLLALLQQTVKLADWGDIDTGQPAQAPQPPTDAAGGVHLW